MPKFFIEQVAICPPNPDAAIVLLRALGLTQWVRDIVVARGTVDAEASTNVAQLAFNYQATRGFAPGAPDQDDVKPLELEVLHYEAGRNWMQDQDPAVSHFGMHCTESELHEFRDLFASHGIGVAQEVNTVSHVNPAIAGKRWYTYVIFNTRPLLGVDLKLIVRREAPPKEAP